MRTGHVDVAPDSISRVNTLSVRSPEGVLGMAIPASMLLYSVTSEGISLTLCRSDVEESTKPSASSSSTQHGMARTTGKQLAPLGDHDDGEINHSASTYFGEAHSTRMYHVDDEVGALHFSSSSQAPPYHEVLSSGVRENYADSRSRLDMSRYLDPATGGSGSERSAESPKPQALSGLADPSEFGNSPGFGFILTTSS